MKIINFEKLRTFSSDEFKNRFKEYKKFLSFIGNPQKNLKTIIITGSAGKGSTAITLANILARHNLKIGLYTSPHLITDRERIKINSKMIKRKDLERLKNYIMNKNKKFNNTYKKKFILSYFEIFTIVAVLYFLENKCDYVILEVGMGGRYDATNITKPEIAIITDICKDHSRYLGKNLLSILNEKREIIKEKSIVITGIKKNTLLNNLKKFCMLKKSKLYILDKDFKVKLFSIDEKEILFNYNRVKLKIPLYSINVIKSIGIAIYAAEKLLKKLNYEYVCKELENLNLPARFQIINKYRKKIILDVAHNLCAINSFVKTVEKLNLRNGILYFTLFNDKELDPILKKLSLITSTIKIVKIDNSREFEKNMIISNARKYFSSISYITNLQKEIYSSSSLLYFVGSFYLVEKVLRIL